MDAYAISMSNCRWSTKYQAFLVFGRFGTQSCSPLSAFSHQRACYTSFAYTSANPRCTRFLYYFFRTMFKIFLTQIFGELFCDVTIEYHMYEYYFSRRWQRCKRNLCSTPSGERMPLSDVFRLNKATVILFMVSSWVIDIKYRRH